jgi:N-acetyl-anhydromuramyl-L-alanine amidase AmpD
MINKVNNEDLKLRDLSDIKCIVLHHTGSNASDEANVNFLNKTDYISAHYLIGRDGTIYKLVDHNRVAYHAGVSEWKGLQSKGNSLNWCSIGIEINSDGYTFTDAQRVATKALTLELMAKYRVPSDLVLRHKDIAPGRKWDPGDALFKKDWPTWESFRNWLTSQTMLHDVIMGLKDLWTRSSSEDKAKIGEMANKLRKLQEALGEAVTK